MADLLGEVDTNVPSRLPFKTHMTLKTESRRKVRVLSPPIVDAKKYRAHETKNREDSGYLVNTPPAEAAYDDGDGYTAGFDEDNMPIDDAMPSSPIQKAVERKANIPVKIEEEEDDDMEVSQAIGDQNSEAANVNISGARPVAKIPKKSSSYPTPESSSPTRPRVDDLNPSTWNEVTSKLNVLSSSATQTAGPGKLRIEDATEEDGSLRFFWTDYTEVNGSLCLFGKVKDRRTGLHVSAFVKVDNILRRLFFLPRVYKQSSCKLVNYQRAHLTICRTRP